MIVMILHMLLLKISILEMLLQFIQMLIRNDAILLGLLCRSHHHVDI